MMTRLFVPSAVLALTLVACSQKATEQMYEEQDVAEAPAPPPADNESAPTAHTTPVAQAPEKKAKDEADFMLDDLTVASPAEKRPMPAAEPMEMEEMVTVTAGRSRGPSAGAANVAPARREQYGVEGGKVQGLMGATDAPAGSGAVANTTPTVPTRGDVATKSVPAPDWTPTVDQNTEAFTHYGINDMTLSEKDRYSTFSIDVDTASYTIARRKLQDGSLPPAAAVRVEEFINYMPYDYASPGAESGSAPFAVHMEAAPNPFDASHHILRIGVQGKDIEAAGRKPMHLTFLVDTSGSMASADKIGLIKQSLEYLVNNLEEEDTVSLVTYAGSTQVILKPTPVTRKSTILDGIAKLSTGGGTAMGSGMELAYQMASENAVPGAENRVIVLSDGDANIGRTSHDEILRTVVQYAEEGITLSTIGFGMGNYKDTMMEQLANKGDGNYYYIDSFEESKKVFGTDLSGTLQVIAKDVKIQVEMNPDTVLAYRLVGYENRDIADQDFRNDRVDAGEVGAGHSVTAIYDVVLRDGYQKGELATVRLRAKKPGPDSPAKEWSTTLSSSAVRKDFASASRDFRIAFTAATFAELLRGSPYAAEITYAQLYEIGKSANRGKAEDQELLSLIKTAGSLSGERGAVSSR